MTSLTRQYPCTRRVPEFLLFCLPGFPSSPAHFFFPFQFLFSFLLLLFPFPSSSSLFILHLFPTFLSNLSLLYFSVSILTRFPWTVTFATQSFIIQSVQLYHLHLTNHCVASILSRSRDDRLAIFIFPKKKRPKKSSELVLLPFSVRASNFHFRGIL